MASNPSSDLHNHEAESAILGLLMTSSSLDGPGPARLLIERTHLLAGDFHLPAHAAMYSSIVALLAVSTPADPVAVWERVKSNNSVVDAGGLQWLLKVHQSADALVTESFANFARMVRDLAIRRRLVSEAREIAAAAMKQDVDVGGLLHQANQRISSIVYRGDTFRTLTEVMLDIQKELQATNESEFVRLLPTGIGALDKLIGGMPPLLFVVGGRPGAGKSAVAATMSQALGMARIKHGIFSLEDRAPWLGYRLLSGASNVPNQRLRFQKLGADEWVRAGDGFTTIAGFSDLILIDDRRRMTAQDIVQSARNMIVNHGVKAIFIDHLLEVKTRITTGNRAQDVGESLGQFRDLANEYEVPVVVFTQLNRGAEAKKQPTMADFKDSGAVEEMARVIVAIVRDGDTIGLCVIKNTNGGQGRVDVKFIGAAAMVAATERGGSDE